MGASAARGAAPRAGAGSPAPLLAAVEARGRRRGEAPFHVPGHARGRAARLLPAGGPAVLGGAMEYDTTELRGLGCLGEAAGPVAEAEARAAAAFGSDRSWFLVNGSSAGVHAAVLATCAPGDSLVLARNAHRSALAALVLSGARPEWVQPEMDAGLGVAHGVTADAVAGALQSAEDAGRRVGAVLVVSPTYFGTCSDIAALARVCRLRGVPLIVDEAHGSHLALLRRVGGGLAPPLGGFPAGALAGGADLVVQSTHKTLPALTQSAMLHQRGANVDPQRVSLALQMLQSSSPSYILMASLDAARAAVEGLAGGGEGGAELRELLKRVALLRRALGALPGVRILGAGSPGVRSADPLRVTVVTLGLGMSGFAAAEELESRFGVVPELATPSCVVLAVSLGTHPADLDQVAAAFEHLARSAAAAATATDTVSGDWAQTPALEMAMAPREAYFAPTENVPLARAAGRVGAELVCPYPPGIPLVVPGSRVTAEALAALQSVKALGGTVTGASDPELRALRVLRRP